MKSEPKIVELDQPINAIGLQIKTDIKNVFKDLPKVYRQYLSYSAKYGIPNKKLPWEYVSLSKNFTENSTWEYLTGHVVTDDISVPEVFIPFSVPTGMYAIFQIKPKFKFLLGLAIGRTKHYIYDTWMKNSKYEFAGYEFEYNNEMMSKKNPNHIDLYVGIREKH